MKNIIQFLQDLEQTEIKKSETKNGLIIATTQRNQIKKDFMSALQLDLENAINQALDNAILLEDVYIGQTADGLVVATEHAKVLNPIPFRINAKIGGLDYDVFDEIQAFKIELQEKAEKKQKSQKK